DAGNLGERTMTNAADIRDGLKAGTITVKKFYELMKVEGRKIDARSADIFCKHGQVMDPYGVRVSEEEDNYGRRYFARALGSDIWVEFNDLPEETSGALWERLRSGKPAESVPFNNRVERVADVIIEAYGSYCLDEPNRARALE